jgi:hypothetical protein
MLGTDTELPLGVNGCSNTRERLATAVVRLFKQSACQPLFVLNNVQTQNVQTYKPHRHAAQAARSTYAAVLPCCGSPRRQGRDRPDGTRKHGGSALGSLWIAPVGLEGE